MGFLEGLTNYWWNWMLWFRSYENIATCFALSGYGLFFDNDNGYLFN